VPDDATVKVSAIARRLRNDYGVALQVSWPTNHHALGDQGGRALSKVCPDSSTGPALVLGASGMTELVGRLREAAARLDGEFAGPQMLVALLNEAADRIDASEHDLLTELAAESDEFAIRRLANRAQSFGNQASTGEKLRRV
jgi:hypothetical protein